MKEARLLCMVFICIGETLAQSNAAPKECQNPKNLVRQVWALEDALIHTGDKPAPATSARELYAKAQILEHELFTCEMAAWDAKDQDTKEMLGAERINLQFIESAQLAYGGLAQVPNPELPSDLITLAPSCKEVVQTHLVKIIENEFMSNDQKLASITSKEIMPYFEKSNQLLKCAYDAQQVGYKDAAIRILSAASTIENAVILADAREQAPIIHVLQSSSQTSSVPIQVGSQNCTATIQDWGWQKTVNWSCY